MRILVADDNQDLLESLAALLEHCGHRVYRAPDGPQALQTAARVHPDAAILDIGMPGLSGYEVARRLRSDAGGERIFLIAHTAWGEEQDKATAYAAGFDRHCTKPLDFAALSRLLAQGRPARPAGGGTGLM
jgi:CheY-like chemotaxis protein